MIEEDQKKKQEIQVKLQEVSMTEETNPNGIMVGSVMTVTVIEARELRSSRITGMLNPYVVVSIEGQRSQTD